jgi:hypothetical protein
MRRTAFLFVLGVFGLAGGLVAAAYADGLPGLPVTTALPVSVTTPTVPAPPPPTTTAVAVTTPVVTATVTVATPTPPPTPAPPPPAALVTTVAASIPAAPLPVAPPAVAHTVTAIAAAAPAATAAVRSAVPAAPDPVAVTTPPSTAPAAPVAKPQHAILPARVLRAAIPLQTIAERLPEPRPRRILRAANAPSPSAAHPAVDAVLESPLAPRLTGPAPSDATAARPAAARDSGLSPAGGLAIAIALAAIAAAAAARSSGVLAHCATVAQATFPTFSISPCTSEPPPGPSPLVRGAGKAPPPTSGVAGSNVTVGPGVRGAGSVLSLPRRVGGAALRNRGVRAVEIILLALVATANVALVAIRARVGRLQHR